MIIGTEGTRNATGIAMTNLHRSPPVNQSETDLGIVNESQLLGFGISSGPCFTLRDTSVNWSKKIPG
jgi:hypothetical protein